MRRTAVVTVSLVLLLAGCGGGGAEEGDGPTGDLPHGLTRCPADPPYPAADESLYRDEPNYLATSAPVQTVRRWAESQPGFVALWVDRDHNGWIAVGFSEGADDRQDDIEELYPAIGVVAVPLDFTAEELEDLRAEVEEAAAPIEGASVNSREVLGTVEVWAGVLDEETLAPLAGYAGDDRVCVEGIDPADAVADGPQPTDRLTGEPYRSGIATTEEQYAALWEESGVGDDRPPVDLDTRVVIWFGAVYGSSCPIRMDDVVVDTEAALVHGAFVVPGNPMACTDDANPRAFLVALDRDRLPAGPFAIQLDAEDPPAGVPEERTVVDVDLREPGSTATDEQVHGDPELVERSEEGYRVEPGGYVETGYPALWEVDLDCDLTVVGPFTDMTWAADDPGAVPPPAWEAAADEEGRLDVELVLRSEPLALTVSAAGTEVTYARTDATPADC